MQHALYNIWYQLTFSYELGLELAERAHYDGGEIPHTAVYVLGLLQPLVGSSPSREQGWPC